MSEKMEFRAHDIVLEYIQRHLDKSDDVPNIEIYTVWKCKILQNWKFLISSSLLDGMYYELTFNGDKNEWYLDAYKKFENQVIREDTVNAPQTKRYDYSKSVMENIKCGNGITREIPQNEKEQPIKIGDEVYVHGFIDEIRNDVIIIRNEGGYFGTVPSEVVEKEETLQNLTKPNKSDLISRQAAIDALLSHFVPQTYTGKQVEQAKKLAEGIMSKVPSAQPFTEEQIQTMQELESAQVEKAFELGKADRPKWIPCSERLPEEGDVVLICSKIGVIDFGKRKGDKWVWLAEALCDYWQETEDLIAWMPLPEAYKESDADGSD